MTNPYSFLCNVIESCKTEEQVFVTENWIYDRIRAFYSGRERADLQLLFLSKVCNQLQLIWKDNHEQRKN